MRGVLLCKTRGEIAGKSSLRRVNMVKGGKRKRKRNNDCSRGRGTVDAEDKISSLPDSLLQHIMFFLEIKDVIRTSLLSRRWRHLWKSAPFLDFHFGPCFSADIASFINRSLMLYEGRKIRRFSVYPRRKLDPWTVDPWIRFAVRHDVEELDMQFFNEYSAADEMFKLPRCILDCGSLRVLKLGSCVLNFPLFFYLPSLTEIHLYCVRVTLLDASGCPLLEKLIIERCNSSLYIHAPNQKLRYLKIEDDDHTFNVIGAPYGRGLTLDAPYLLSIEFTEHLRRFHDLKNLSSLQTATFNVSAYHDDADGLGSITLVKLLKKVGDAKAVKLSYSCIEMLEGNLEIPPLGATCLDLAINVSHHIPVLTSFLRSSRCLQALTINICCRYYDEEIWFSDKYSIDKLALWDLELALSSLQINTVAIHDFLKSQSEWFYEEADPSLYMNKFLKNCHEVKLLKILLKCCKSLNRITIHTIKECWLEPNFLCGLKEKLLALPRGSENAMIDIF